MKQSKLFIAIISCYLAGCQPLMKENSEAPAPVVERPTLSANPSASESKIPKPAFNSTALPIPEPEQKEPVHTVVVSDVPIRDLLFSLARDAKFNLDLDANVEGNATLNAINQPLATILDRISKNNGLRYDINNGILRIQKDMPFIRNYQVDYLNLSRSASGTVNVSTQINATGPGAGAEGSGGGSGGVVSVPRLESTNKFRLLLTKYRPVAKGRC